MKNRFISSFAILSLAIAGALVVGLQLKLLRKVRDLRINRARRWKWAIRTASTLLSKRMSGQQPQAGADRAARRGSSTRRTLGRRSGANQSGCWPHQHDSWRCFDAARRFWRLVRSHVESARTERRQSFDRSRWTRRSATRLRQHSSPGVERAGQSSPTSRTTIFRFSWRRDWPITVSSTRAKPSLKSIRRTSRCIPRTRT